MDKAESWLRTFLFQTMRRPLLGYRSAILRWWTRWNRQRTQMSSAVLCGKHCLTDGGCWPPRTCLGKFSSSATPSCWVRKRYVNLFGDGVVFLWLCVWELTGNRYLFLRLPEKFTRSAIFVTSLGNGMASDCKTELSGQNARDWKSVRYNRLQHWLRHQSEVLTLTSQQCSWAVLSAIN